MAYDGFMTLSFAERPLSYTDMVRLLIQHGWSVDNGLSSGLARAIVFTADEGNFEEDVAFPVGDNEPILALLARAELRGRTFGISLCWGETGAAVTMISHPGQEKVSFALDYGVMQLDGLA